MKQLFAKLTLYVSVVTVIYSCSNNDTKTIDAIQGKWYNINGTEKTIEIKGDKWIEGDEEFGKMTCLISRYNDSITELKVIENQNTITYFTTGMKNYIKIRLDSTSDVFHFEQTDSTGRKGFNCYFTTNKAKIQPYEPKE
jgi:hypothetical protein